MLRLIRRIAADESGAAAIEYGLVAALVAVAIIAVLGTVGTSLVARLDSVVEAIVEAGS